MTKGYTIIDTTLREGEQTPGLLFSLAEKKRIIDGLAQVGVTEIELGISSHFHSCLKPLVTYCRKTHPKLLLSLWCRCNTDDISHAADIQPDILSLSIPTSDIHLYDRLKKDRTWALTRMVASIDYAKKLQMSVSIGFEDATRSNTIFLSEMAKTASQKGVERIRLADTVGIASPTEFTKLVAPIVRQLPHCNIAVHTHNDFGMATANAIAALEAGAQTVDAVILGLGERTGCARLEEVIGYLRVMKGIEELKVEHLKPLSSYVAKLTGKTIAGNRPIIGKDIFTCETGLHLQGLQSHPKTYEPFSPDLVQAQRTFLYGAKAGRNAIRHHMKELNDGNPVHLTDTAVQAIREVATGRGRPLNDSELLEVISTFQEC